MEGNRSRRQTTDHITVDIGNPNQNIVSSIIKELETISPSVCIHRVPERLRKVNEKAFIPETLSIGPLHHSKESLKFMETQKWRYLRSLLCRKPTLETSLNDCVKAIKELEQRIRNCYSEISNLNSDEFVEMMLVDGCFIIELFLKYTLKGLRHKDDPLFSTNWKLIKVRTDMLLMENQLPFFVLQRLFNLVPIPEECNQSLPELAFSFFKIRVPGNKQVLQKKFSQEGNHLLDLLRNCYLPSFPKLPAKQQGRQKSIRCAAKLKESGIKLKKATTDSLLDIQFVKGVLQIPPSKIHEFTDSLFRNLIALEHCYEDITMPITSYVFFMHSLIQSSKDVKLLHRRGIITNHLGNDEAVPELFKKLCKEMVINDSYYAGLLEQVNAHHSTNFHVWWAMLKHDFLRTSNSVLLFGVAILVLALTFTGTLYSILSFYLHHS